LGKERIGELRVQPLKKTSVVGVWWKANTVAVAMIAMWKICRFLNDVVLTKSSFPRTALAELPNFATRKGMLEGPIFCIGPWPSIAQILAPAVQYGQ